MSRRDLPNRIVRNAIVRLAEVDVVKQVEKFRPELKRGMFRNAGVLYQPEVGVEKARPSQNVSARVAKGPIRVGDEISWVEILLDQLAVRPVGVEVSLAETRPDKVGPVN